MKHAGNVVIPEKLPSLSMPEYGAFLLSAVSNFKDSVRTFFYQVMMSQYSCPRCNGDLVMREGGLSSCSKCGNRIDPTVEFQRCDQCGGRLIKKTYHYHCKACKNMAKSRFLFNEKVFDSTYFCRMMKQSRECKRQIKAQIQTILGETRSEPLIHKDCPNLEEIEGLNEALDNMVSSPIPKDLLLSMAKSKDFSLKRYKEHILKCLEEVYEILFDKIRPLIENEKRDRAFRFVALIFMNHFREVELIQYGDKLMVEKIETDSQR